MRTTAIIRPRLSPAEIRAVQDRRRGNAAGLHRKRRPDRHNTKRNAIADAQQ